MKNVIPHSGPTRELKHNATRKEKMTVNHSGHVAPSGMEGLGNPRGVSRKEQKFTTTPQIIPHSPVAVPKDPRKWNKKKMSAAVATRMED